MSSPLVVLERAVALHRALDDAGIPHALGGALALGYHVSEPRGTRDIDVNVARRRRLPHRARLDELLRLVREPDKDVPVAAEIFGRRKRLGD